MTLKRHVSVTAGVTFVTLKSHWQRHLSVTRTVTVTSPKPSLSLPVEASASFFWIFLKEGL